MTAPSSACSFCELPRSRVLELVVAPSASICNFCVDAARAFTHDASRSEPAKFPTCSFCEESVMRGQFVGARAHICDTCVAICVDVIAEKRAAVPLPQARVIKH